MSDLIPPPPPPPTYGNIRTAPPRLVNVWVAILAVAAVLVAGLAIGTWREVEMARTTDACQVQP